MPKEQYIVFCSAPGKKGATPFQGEDEKRVVRTYYVELNKSVSVPKWVYDIWVGSYWNQDRAKTQEEVTAESHITNGDE